MNLDEFRLKMKSYRGAVDKEAIALKDSFLAQNRMRALYEKFDSDERDMADRVLAEWTLSEDDALRFDALALIDQFKITTTLPAVRTLASRLASSTAPGAPYELEKVARVIQTLVKQASPSCFK
jgi:hypothetical protein